MLFALICIDKPNALETRMGAREAHLAYVRGKLDQLKLGGPFLDENGDMAGSLMVVEAQDRAAVEAFSRDDPYTQAGLWERVEIRPFRVTLGSL
jgi:uncharacterized protein